MNKKIAGLVLLSVVPTLAGLVRLLAFSTDAVKLDGHDRFAADPLTAMLHIIGGTAFATLGAFQFMPSLRRGAWHRIAGRVLSALGIVAAIAGVRMALSWPAKEWDSPALNSIRVVVAFAMVSFIVISFVAARRRDFEAHGAWMTRAYALWAAAGTQAFTMTPFTLPFMESFRSEGLYAALMASGWVINALAAEWVLHKSQPPATLRLTPR